MPPHPSPLPAGLPARSHFREGRGEGKDEGKISNIFGWIINRKKSFANGII
jgi:hypothetical protein